MNKHFQEAMKKAKTDWPFQSSQPKKDGEGNYQKMLDDLEIAHDDVLNDKNGCLLNGWRKIQVSLWWRWHCLSWYVDNQKTKIFKLRHHMLMGIQKAFWKHWHVSYHPLEEEALWTPVILSMTLIVFKPLALRWPYDWDNFPAATGERQFQYKSLCNPSWGWSGQEQCDHHSSPGITFKE